MAQTGDVWSGGYPDPPQAGDQFVAWRWQVHSKNPCALCAGMNGQLVASLPIKHPGCTCTFHPDFSTSFVERQLVDQTGPEYMLEQVGIVPGNGSKSFTTTVSGSGNVSVSPVGFGLGLSLGETTTLTNPDDEDIPVYAVYITTTTTYCDLWRSWQGDHHEDIHQEVTWTHTEFHTLTTNPDQYR